MWNPFRREHPVSYLCQCCKQVVTIAISRPFTISKWEAAHFKQCAMAKILEQISQED